MGRHRTDGADGEYGGAPQHHRGRRFLSYADLEERYGKSRITLWRWVRAGRLPAPYELGPNTVGFALAEILAAESNLKRRAYAPSASTTSP